MSRSLPVNTAIVVARDPGLQERLGALFAELIDANIVVTVVAEPDEATSRLIMADAAEVQSVLIDASDAAGGDPAALGRTLDAIRIITAVPDVAPILLAPSPPSALVIRAFRAGAGDFIDLDTEARPEVTTLLQRVADAGQQKARHRTRLRGLRAVLDDFLKNLVKTERRTIDLEHQLALHERGAWPALDGDPGRRAAVMVIEDDPEVMEALVACLHEAGLATFACESGEDAVARLAEILARGEAVDLALVDAHLPGMNGIEAIHAMRDQVPQLPAMLMTGFSDSRTAIRAADIGVVGYVLKPFDDMVGLVKRIKERAVKNMNSTREYRYLEQIKQRHEKTLSRYRKLAAELEWL